MKNFLDKLNETIPQFKWTKSSFDNDSFHGVALIDPYEFRDKHKTLYINSDKHIFISDELYKGEERSFRYCICYQKQLKRGYRKKNFIEIEANKIYVSGKTLDEIYKKLFDNPEFIRFIVSK